MPFLPLSHVFERAAGHYYGMYVGITASYAEDIDSLLADFREKRPTMILAVPRVCEKVYQKIMERVEASPPLKKRLFQWALGVGGSVNDRLIARNAETGSTIGHELDLAHPAVAVRTEARVVTEVRNVGLERAHDLSYGDLIRGPREASVRSMVRMRSRTSSSRSRT